MLLEPLWDFLDEQLSDKIVLRLAHYRGLSEAGAIRQMLGQCSIIGDRVEQLIRLYLMSMRALLKAAGLPEEAVQRVLEEIFSGSATGESECAILLARHGSGDLAMTAEVAALVGALARVVPSLGRPTVNDETLEAAAAVMRDVGDVALQLDIVPMAYNFFEIAWHLGGIFDRPALDVAQRLWDYADPDNVDQYHGAIWRLAIERLRHVFDSTSDYLPALDALELALTCHIPSEPIRRDLFDRLQAQIKRAQGTPLEDLVAIVAVNVPPGVWDDTKRLAAQQALAALRFGDRAFTLNQIEAEFIAIAEAQTMLDDLRLKLAPDEKEGAQINWHDLRYRDSRLASAVPVGRSLIADPARSGRATARSRA